MGRPRKKPEYDPETVMKQLLSAISECYLSSGGTASAVSLRSVADEFGFTHLKARKLLITADAYGTEISDEVQALKAEGKTIPEIMKITGLGRASVHSYLPYTKIIYNASELSLNAERIRRFKARREAVRQIEWCAENGYKDVTRYAWKAVKEFSDYPFVTDAGKRFKYTVAGWRIYFNKDEALIKRDAFNIALDNALRLNGEVTDPDQLGVEDAAYLLPVLRRFGLIKVADA